MQPIPEEIVKRINNEFSDIEQSGLKDKGERVYDQQPELLAFLQASINELEEQKADIAVYLFFMVIDMYREAYDAIADASPEQIMSHYQENESLLGELSDDQEGLEDEMEKFNTDQPVVLEYITEILKRAEDEERGGLSSREQSYIFLIIVTIMNVLDECVEG